MRKALREEPFSGDVVDLQADPIGVLKKYRIVARRPRAVFRRMDDMGTDAHEEVVHGVHIGALAGAEAHVVEPDAELLEALVTPGVLGADDADGRPPAPARRVRPPLLARIIHEPDGPHEIARLVAAFKAGAVRASSTHCRS